MRWQCALTVEQGEALDALTDPSHGREFLKCTNGPRQPLEFVLARGGDFWSAEEIDWFRVRNQEWIEAWAADLFVISDELYFVYGPEQDSINLRPEYLEHALEISTRGDSSVHLLNPKIAGVDGEWEAWFFASWSPAIGSRFLLSRSDKHVAGRRLLGSGLATSVSIQAGCFLG